MTIPIGYAQVGVHYVGANAPTGAVNLFGVRLDEVTDTPDTVAAKVVTVWTDNVMPHLTNDVTMSGVRVKFGPDDTGAFGDLGVAVVGGNAVTSLAPNTSYLTTKTTALGGRRGRGRMYLPGVAEEAANDSGDLSGGYITLIATALAGVIEDLSAAEIPMVLLHSPATEWVLVDGQPRRQPIAGAIPDPTIVIGGGVSSRVATQRRRLRR